MRMRLLIPLVLLLLAAPALAQGENITFVTNHSYNLETTCNNMIGEDRVFCDHLASLNYHITIIKEEFVRDYAQSWKDTIANSQLIFVGELSSDYYNSTNPARATFCGNISAAANPPPRKLFITSVSNINDTAQNISGCAFGQPLNLVGWDPAIQTNNSCPPGEHGVQGYAKIKEGFITAGLPTLPALFSLYNTPLAVLMHGSRLPDANGWIGVDCAASGPAGTYSVVNTTDRGVFWGLNKPSQFNDAAWRIFDRTLLYVLNETNWTITLNALPANISAGNRQLLSARVLERGAVVSSGSLNYTMKNSTGSIVASGPFSYETNGRWWSRSVQTLPTPGAYTIELTSADQYNWPRGVLSSPYQITTGNLTVTITSGNYNPGSSYQVTATFYNGSTPVLPTGANYRILNSSDLSQILAYGLNMNCGTGSCTGQIDSTFTSTWRDPVLLEVTSAMYGGDLKQINLSSVVVGTLTTNKAIYKPLETANFTLTTNAAIDGATITLTDSTGGTIFSNAPMNRTNSSSWFFPPFSLPQRATNGTWTAKVNMSVAGSSSLTTKNFDVVPYSLLVSAGPKSRVNAGESIAPLFKADSPYSNTLNFTVVVNITSPGGITDTIGTRTLSGPENSWTINYTLSSDASGGDWSLNWFVNDSDDRRFNKSASFTVDRTGNMTLRPTAWSLTTNTSGLYNQTFTITNIGLSSLTGISVSASPSLSGNVTITPAAIINISAGGNSSFTATWNASTVGPINGTINVSAPEIAPFVVAVSLNLQPVSAPSPPPLPASKLKASPSFLSFIVPLDGTTSGEFTLSNDATIAASGVTATLSGAAAQYLSLGTVANTIDSNDEAAVTVAVDATGAEAGDYSGTIDTNSSVGSASIPVTLHVVKDLVAEADVISAQLTALEENITELQKSGENVSAAEERIGQLRTLIQDIKDSYAAGEYSDAETKLTEAQGELDAITNLLSNLQKVDVPAKRSSGLIWIFATIIIIIVVGVTGYKYKDKLTELIRKKPPSPPPEEYPEEGYPPEAPPQPPKEAPPEEKYRPEYY